MASIINFLYLIKILIVLDKLKTLTLNKDIWKNIRNKFIEIVG